MNELPMAKAINEGLKSAMTADDKVMMMGQDIAQLGEIGRASCRERV